MMKNLLPVRLSFICCQDLLLALLTFLTSVNNWDSGMQEAEEDGHHRRLRPVRQDQAARLKGEEDWEEEKDNDQECEPQSVLQRILCICR